MRKCHGMASFVVQINVYNRDLKSCRFPTVVKAYSLFENYRKFIVCFIILFFCHFFFILVLVLFFFFCGTGLITSGG